MMAGFNYNKQFVVCTSIDNEYKRCCCILELEGQANVEWEDLHLKVARVNQHPPTLVTWIGWMSVRHYLFHSVPVHQLTPLIIFPLSI
jgi:hypothetical protein